MGNSASCVRPSSATPLRRRRRRHSNAALPSLNADLDVGTTDSAEPCRTNRRRGLGRRRHQSFHSIAASSHPELYLYTKPSGLYPSCTWDAKVVRRLILRHELAPRYPGLDEVRGDGYDDEECPICMLAYPILNATKCCKGRLCTECYLQIRPQRHNKEACPFCKHRKVEAVLACKPVEQSEEEEEDKEIKGASESERETEMEVGVTLPVNLVSQRQRQEGSGSGSSEADVDDEDAASIWDQKEDEEEEEQCLVPTSDNTDHNNTDTNTNNNNMAQQLVSPEVIAAIANATCPSCPTCIHCSPSAHRSS